MKRVLFVLKSISTHSRQNALCVEKVAYYLKQNNVNVDYVSYELQHCTEQSEEIFPVYVTNGANIRMKSAITKLIFPPLSDLALVKALSKEIMNCCRKKNYDAIISVINPPETAEALYIIKKLNPTIRAILYEIDPNSNRFKNPRNLVQMIWRMRTTRWEKHIYNSMDYIVHMYTHKTHYNKKTFRKYNEKTMYLDIPNFSPMSIHHEKPSEVIKMIYGGAFYPVLREPYIMIETLALIDSISPISLSIYTGDIMRKELEESARKHSFISLNNPVSQDKLLEEMLKSDVLISIGNRDSDFLPSKTLLYMSTGLPILHFYSDENDVSKKYLEKYPAVLLINENETSNKESLVSQIMDFIGMIKKGYEVDFDKLRLSLERNTPEYTAKKLLELL